MRDCDATPCEDRPPSDDIETAAAAITAVAEDANAPSVPEANAERDEAAVADEFRPPSVPLATALLLADASTFAAWTVTLQKFPAPALTVVSVTARLSV
jgi:hypothetical protein